MLTIRDHCASQAVGMDAGRLTSMLAVAEIHAAVKENFTDHPDGGHTCKLCGEHVNHPRAAAAHLAVHHHDALVAGGPGSGPRPVRAPTDNEWSHEKMRIDNAVKKGGAEERLTRR
jgi:hypothetical protein